MEGAGLELVDLPLGAWTHDGGTLRTASAIDVRLIPSHQSAAPPGPTACKRAGRDVAPSLTGPLAGRRGLGHRGLARRQIRELVAAAWPAASEETPRRLNPASRFTEETSLTMGTGPKAPSHTLRESLPVLTLALPGTLVAQSASLDGRRHASSLQFAPRMAPRPDHRVRTNDAVACQRDPVRALDPTRTRSRDRPRRRGVAADRHSSKTTRAARPGYGSSRRSRTTARRWYSSPEPGAGAGRAITAACRTARIESRSRRREADFRQGHGLGRVGSGVKARATPFLRVL